MRPTDRPPDIRPIGAKRARVIPPWACYRDRRDLCHTLLGYMVQAIAGVPCHLVSYRARAESRPRCAQHARAVSSLCHARNLRDCAKPLWPVPRRGIGDVPCMTATHSAPPAGSRSRVLFIALRMDSGPSLPLGAAELRLSGPMVGEQKLGEGARELPLGAARMKKRHG